jgi:hypothetical protein
VCNIEYDDKCGDSLDMRRRLESRPSHLDKAKWDGSGKKRARTSPQVNKTLNTRHDINIIEKASQSSEVYLSGAKCYRGSDIAGYNHVRREYFPFSCYYNHYSIMIHRRPQ